MNTPTKPRQKSVDATLGNNGGGLVSPLCPRIFSPKDRVTTPLGNGIVADVDGPVVTVFIVKGDPVVFCASEVEHR